MIDKLAEYELDGIAIKWAGKLYLEFAQPESSLGLRGSKSGVVFNIFCNDLEVKRSNVQMTQHWIIENKLKLNLS